MSDERSDARRRLIANAAFGGSIALYVALAVWLLIAGPPEVIGHFGANNGNPRFDPTGEFVAIMTVMVGGMVALFLAVPTLMRRIPIEFVNVPNRERWDTPERRAILARRTGADMNLMGAATVLMFVAMMVLSTLGGLGETIPDGVFVALLTVYVAFIAALCVTMLRGSRYVAPPLEGERTLDA